MPAYQQFEDLPVWQSAADLYDAVDDLLENAPPRLRSSVRDQLERAALSISNNIAEGFERGTTKELLAFLYIARGSAGEVRSVLKIVSRRPWAAVLRPQIARLLPKCESCSRQLRAWADSLQNSEITGHRHLTNKSRADYREQQARKDRARLQLAPECSSTPPSAPQRPRISNLKSTSSSQI